MSVCAASHDLKAIVRSAPLLNDVEAQALHDAIYFVEWVSSQPNDGYTEYWGWYLSGYGKHVLDRVRARLTHRLNVHLLGIGRA